MLSLLRNIVLICVLPHLNSSASFLILALGFFSAAFTTLYLCCKVKSFLYVLPLLSTPDGCSYSAIRIQILKRWAHNVIRDQLLCCCPCQKINFLFYSIMHFRFLLCVRFWNIEVPAFVGVYCLGPILDVRYIQVSTFLQVGNSRLGCTCNQTTVSASTLYIWPNTIETRNGDKSYMLQLFKGLQQALSVTLIAHQLMVSCYTPCLAQKVRLLCLVAAYLMTALCC